jgi:hypothetical protein
LAAQRRFSLAMFLNDDLSSPLELDGRIWLRGALDDAALAPFDAACALTGPPDDRRKAGRAVAPSLAPGAPLPVLIARLSQGAHAVRAVSRRAPLDPGWSAPWRQGRVITVEARARVEGYSNWALRAGIWHCEPPVKVLVGMLATRVFLDDAEDDDGALQIAVGSHRHGIVTVAGAAEIARGCPQETCRARRGDVLVTRMLTLSRSLPAHVGRARRSVRVDFASHPLPGPLVWAM